MEEKNTAIKRFTLRLNGCYALIHGSYWMLYGVLCSFSSLLLLSRGFSNSEIGLMLALSNLAAVLVQPFLADLADKGGRFGIFRQMRIMAAACMLLCAGLLILRSRSMFLAVVFCLAFAVMMVLQPFANAVGGRLEETGSHINFGVCRSVGSLTYAVLCAVLGRLAEDNGTWVLPAAGELVLAAVIASVVITERTKNAAMAAKAASEEAGDPGAQGSAAAAQEPERAIGLGEFARRHRFFIIASIGTMGVYFSNSILNTYMAQIVMNVGGDASNLGNIFFILAFVEIPTMVLFDRLARRFRCGPMLIVAAFAFAAKMALCLIAKNVTMLFIAQFMQPFSFALFLPAMVRFIDDSMEKGEAVKGHTVFTAMTMVGGIFASVLGGIVLDASGAKALLAIGTAVTALGGLIICLTIGKAEKEGRDARWNSSTRY